MRVWFDYSVMNLTDDELAEAAMCARIGREQALADAAKQSNPAIRMTFEAQARRRAELASRLESVRKSFGKSGS